MSLSKSFKRPLDDQNILRPSKKNNRISISLYAAVKAWILWNYETADDSFVTTVNDILSHASSKNMSSPIYKDGDIITTTLIRRAVEGVFSRKPSRMHMNKKKVQAYRGLKQKHDSQQPSVKSTNPIDDWKSFVLHAEDSASSMWNVVKSTNTSVCFARFEKVQYNNQLVVCEVCFTKKEAENCTETNIKYHERELPEELVCTLDSNFGDCTMKERAVLWMKFLDSTFVCHGFHTDFEFADERIAKHHVIMEDYDISEDRAFSIHCEILTNSAGVRCSKCSEEKIRLDRKILRRMLAKDKPLPPTANHRYMTKEQILEKLERKKQ